MNDSNTTPQRVTRALVASVALVCAMAGQFALYAAPTGLLLGLVLSAVAVLLFVWISVRWPPAWMVRLVARFGFSPSTLLVGLAVTLSVMTSVVTTVYQQLGHVTYLRALILWGGSAVTYGMAFAIGRPWLDGWQKWLQVHWRELVTIGLVTLAAAGLRFYQLGAIPRVISGDEGLLGQAALLTRQLPLANPFALFANFGSVYLQAINLALSLLGQTPLGLRFVPALGGTLAIPALYTLGRYLFGRRVALLAACLLAASHAHIHFSRTVAVGYIQGTLLIPLELYFLISGLEKRSTWRLAIGGMILGMHFSVYISAQIVAALLLIYVLVLSLLCRPLIQKAGRSVFVFWFGMTLMALPQAVYAWQHQGEFLARLNADGTFQSGWLAATMAQTGQSAPQILAGRVAHAFLSLNHYPALDFYGATMPLLDPMTGVLFVLGLGFGLWHIRNPRFLLLNTYFWGVTVAVGTFAVPPSADSYRMLIGLPAAILLAAIGLDQVLSVSSLTEPSRRAVRIGLLTLLLIAVLSINARAYFMDFAAQCRHGGDPETRFASYLGNYLRTLDRETTVYLLSDDVFRYGTHPSADFLSGNRLVTNFPSPVSSLKRGAQMAVIAAPSRADELRDWVDDHPGGRLQREYDCDKLMLIAYYVP